MTAHVKFPAPESLMAEACESHGLSDFGQDTEALKANLRRFLDCVDREGLLTEAASAQQVALVRRRLANRLQIEAWYKAHPELGDAEVGPLVSITGLPRSGTTALVNIMSLDDQFRPLRTWEQDRPCPPPILGEEDQDPRRLAAVAHRDYIARERPDLMAMHLFDPDATEEDVEILGLTFQAQQYAMPIFSYHAWWRTADLGPAFAYHRRVLRLLQSRRPPNRWLLKAPAHCFHLDALTEAYPGAKMIVTHRDPAKSVPSAISMVATLQASAGKVEIEEIGRRAAEHFRVGTERTMASRARLGDDRFFDLHHADFVADPFGALERVYDFLGLELTSRTLAKMEAWHAQNRSGAHGAHRYAPEDFGLTAARLRADFRPYIERYGVRLEG
jgi:hypothetical protein